MYTLTEQTIDQAVDDWATWAAVEAGWRASNYMGASPDLVERWLVSKYVCTPQELAESIHHYFDQKERAR